MGFTSRKTAAALLTLASIATAAPTASEPDPATTSPTAAATLPDGPLRVIVQAFAGSVQARQNSEDAWANVVEGQEFDEGVEFRTGVRSVVKFKIPPDSDLTVDRLGVVKILRATIENGAIKTDVGMKYGRTRYDIEAAGRVHDATIRSTTSVLAIRGTDVILDDTPGFAPRAVSFTGRASFRDDKGRQSSLGSSGGNPNRPVRIDAAAGGSAAETGLQRSVTISPLNAGRTANENQLVINIPQTGGLPPPPGTPSGGGSALVQSVNSGSSTVAPPPLPPPPPADFPSLVGRLEFILTWQGNADLNIGLVSPLGEPITTNPSVVTSTPPRQVSPIATVAPRSGGVAGPDDPGGPNGGRETITWPNGFPSGRYDYGVKYNTGSNSAQYTVDVLVNGVTLDPRTTGTLTGPGGGEAEFEGEIIVIEAAPNSSAAQSTSSNTAQGAKKKRKKK